MPANKQKIVIKQKVEIKEKIVVTGRVVKKEKTWKNFELEEGMTIMLIGTPKEKGLVSPERKIEQDKALNE